MGRKRPFLQRFVLGGVQVSPRTKKLKKSIDFQIPLWDTKSMEMTKIIYEVHETDGERFCSIKRFDKDCIEMEIHGHVYYMSEQLAAEISRILNVVS